MLRKAVPFTFPTHKIISGPILLGSVGATVYLAQHFLIPFLSKLVEPAAPNTQNGQSSDVNSQQGNTDNPAQTEQNGQDQQTQGGGGNDASTQSPDVSQEQTTSQESPEVKGKEPAPTTNQTNEQTQEASQSASSSASSSSSSSASVQGSGTLQSILEKVDLNEELQKAFQMSKNINGGWIEGYKKGELLSKNDMHKYLDDFASIARAWLSQAQNTSKKP